jgi:hypothetical protein
MTAAEHPTQGRAITLESDYAEDLRRALDVLGAEG